MTKTMDKPRKLSTIPYHYADLTISFPKEWLDSEFTIRKSQDLFMYSDLINAAKQSSARNNKHFEEMYPADWEERVQYAYSKKTPIKFILEFEFSGIRLASLRYLKFSLNADEYSQLTPASLDINLVSSSKTNFVIKGYEIKRILELVGRSFYFYIWGIFVDEHELHNFLDLTKLKSTNLSSLSLIKDPKDLKEILGIETSSIPNYSGSVLATDLVHFWNKVLTVEDIEAKWLNYKNKHFTFTNFDEFIKYLYFYRRDKFFAQAMLDDLKTYTNILEKLDLGGQFVISEDKIVLQLFRGIIEQRPVYNTQSFSWADLVNSPTAVYKQFNNWHLHLLRYLPENIMALNHREPSIYEVITHPDNQAKVKVKPLPMEGSEQDDIFGVINYTGQTLTVKNEIEELPTTIGVVDKDMFYFWLPKLKAYIEEINTKIETSDSYTAILNKNSFWNQF